MQHEYGETSARTKKIKSLIDQVTDLASSSTASIGDVQDMIATIDDDYAGIDDVFVTSARKTLADIAEDGRLSEDDLKRLASFGALFDNPVSDEPVESIGGKSFVLTGDFAVEGGKDVVQRMIVSGGGLVKSGVSRRTDYLVVGELGSSAWGYGSFGTKVKKALDLVLTGKGKVRIVSEAAFLACAQEEGGAAARALREQQERFERQRESTRVVPRDFRGLTEGQQRVMDLVDAGENVYLTGLGGTGKSFILERIISAARERGKNVIACAPTGIAALNIGGSTIHRALGISAKRILNPKGPLWIEEDSPLILCDLMIIDEISMCRMDLFDCLSLTLKRAATLRKDGSKSPCQLVVVGDFCQLPPVLPKEERPILEESYGYDVRGAYPFMGTEWDSWDFKGVELTEAIRQRDATFVTALNACRVGDTSGLRWIEEHASATVPKNAIILCGTNDKANRENNAELSKLPGAKAVYQGSVDGEVRPTDMPTLERLELKPGARVMALVNDSEDTYMNGSLGSVLRCGRRSVRVRFDNGSEVEVPRHTWEVVRPTSAGGRTRNETIGTFSQIPLKLAYAITIHKSQGQTFEAASIYPDCWDPGQLYTALSRVTSIEGLHLAHHCPDGSLITSQEVLDFYEGRELPKGKATKADSEAKGGATPEKATTKAPGRGQHRWTPEEERYILDNPSASAAELAASFGVTKKAVERKRSKLRKRCEG